jgi:outer membrane protein, multidrug efflux system
MKRLHYSTFFILCTLTACNFAPKYSRPEMALPTEWRVESEVGDTLANLNWWELWEDAVLNEYIQVALENNKDLKVAMWRVNQYLEQWRIAKSSLLPHIELNGSAVKERFPIDLDFLPRNASPISPNYTLDLSLAYELDFWGKIRNTSSAAYSDYLAQVENRRTVVLTLVGSVAQSYVTLRQLDLQVNISKETTESRRESLEIATYRFEGGITSQIEVDQALSVYEESKEVVSNLERLREQQENLLCVLLGDTPKSLKRGKSLTDLCLPNAVPSGMPSDVLTRRPDILQAENTLKAANANIGVALLCSFLKLT